MPDRDTPGRVNRRVFPGQLRATSVVACVCEGTAEAGITFVLPEREEVQTMRSFLRTAATVVLIILAAAGLAWAQGNGNGNGSKKPEITAALVSVDQTVLFVQGANLGAHPSVTLGDVQLGGVAVDASGRQLSANLPVLTPGTYLLTLTTGPWTTEFAVAVDGSQAAGSSGATGPEGPAGPQGPAGPAGPPGATGPAGPMPFYIAAWVRGNAVIRFGAGLTVARFGLTGSYRITIPATPTGRFLVTTVTPVGVNTIARVVQFSRNALDGSSTIDIETHDATTGASVDSDFNFIAIDQS